MDDENELYHQIQSIYADCVKLVMSSIGNELPIAGNIAIFCQNKSDYARYSALSRRLTYESNDPKQKYFQLISPFTIMLADVPEATFTHLYVRKPAQDTPEAGDVDFIQSSSEYIALRAKVTGHGIPHAHTYGRPGWDMVELKQPSINAIAYICTEEMAVKVRTYFSV